MASDVSDWLRRTYLGGVGSLLGLGFLSGDAEAAKPAVRVQRTTDAVTLENDHVRVVFDGDNGGIRQLTAKDTDTDLRRHSDDSSTRAAWLLRFYKGDRRWMQAPSWSAGQASIDVSESDTETTVSLTWSDPQIFASDVEGVLDSFDGTVTIRVTLREGERFVRWNGSLTSDDDTHAVRKFRYPFITRVRRLGGDDRSSLVVPQRMGRRIPDPTRTDGWPKIHHPSGYGTMQFLAYTHPAGGFYFDSRDSEGYSKSFGLQPFRSGKSLYHEFAVPAVPGEDVTVPYDVTLGSHRGDWYDAADRYRTWLEDSDVFQSDPSSVPDWYGELGASHWATSYFRPEADDVSPDMSFETTVDGILNANDAVGAPMQFMWNGYQTHGKFGYGDWFPPKEGWEAFRTAIERMQDADVTPAGFVNARKLYETSELYQADPDEARSWLRRNPDGSVIGGQKHNLTRYFPHIAADGWFDAVSTAVTTWDEEGGRQAWVDGVPAGGQKPCFATSHDHLPGIGGKQWANGIRESLRDLQSETSPSFLLSGENIADFFLEEVDIQNTRDATIEHWSWFRERSEVIPLTQYALGHRLQIQAQNHTFLKDIDFSLPLPYQRLALARSLAWGTLPMFRTHIDVSPEFNPGLLSYLSRIAWVFSLHGRRFVKAGRMIRPPTVESPTTTVTAAVSRIGGGSGTNSNTVPTVHVSAWTTENEDEQAVLLTEITDDGTTVTLQADDPPFAVTDETFSYAVINGTYERIEGPPYEIDLRKDDVVLVVSAPRTSERTTAFDRLLEAQAVAAEDSEELTAVKRAFAEGAFERAVQRATSLVDTQTATATTTDSTTAAGSTGQPTTAEDTTPATSSVSTDSDSSGGTPGFTLTGAVSSLLGAAYLIKSRLRDDEDE